MVNRKSKKPKNIEGTPLKEGPVLSSTFHFSDIPSDSPFTYGRLGNPTWTALEKKLGNAEGAQSLVFPSGMAAIASILTSFTKTDDQIVLPKDGYHITRLYAENFLIKYGVNLKFIPTKDIAEVDLEGVRLILLETPSNPNLDVCDIKKITDKASKTGTLVGVDNTAMTYLGQTPLDLGADFSIYSDTKTINGHSDVLFGHVTSRNEALMTEVRKWREYSGNIPGPMETWLVDRGMQTLELRLERQVGNAMGIARFLEDHPRVKSVRYPGLERDPSHTLAKTQMKNFGFLITFDLETKERANTFLEQSHLLTNTTSFGGIHSMAERRARWGADDISEGVIRLSVGCEKGEALIEDIREALV